MSFKHILVPLFGLDSDRTALDAALAIARANQGHIQALHAVADRSPSSCTSTLVRGTTTVTPVLENGLGCETCGVSVMRMVRLPWATAILLMRTVSPITIKIASNYTYPE